MAEHYITNTERLFHEYRLSVNMVEQACPELADINVTRIALEAQDVLDESKHLLSGENVWPYYDRVVRAGACDSIIETIGLLSSLMFVVGLIFFPLCAILTHRFLLRWADWAAWFEASEEKKKNSYS